MPRTDLTFQAIKLLSQYIVSNPDKIPEGEILQKTSCMNPDDAELVGLGYALADRIERRNPERAKRFRERVLKLLEYQGLSKWTKGELTHLGFRAGTRYEQTISLGDIDEVSVSASSRSRE